MLQQQQQYTITLYKGIDDGIMLQAICSSINPIDTSFIIGGKPLLTWLQTAHFLNAVCTIATENETYIINTFYDEEEVNAWLEAVHKR